MNIKSAIVHQIEKERHKDPILHQKEELLTVDDKLIDLIKNLKKLYNSKTGRGYGIFYPDPTNYPFILKLASYIADECDFLSHSIDAVNILMNKIKKAQLATGGYILFVDYEENSTRYIIIASIKQHPGMAFNEYLNLTDSTHIDMGSLHEMARIDITSWANKDPDKRYISFAKHRGGRDGFSDYFKEFIGCHEVSSSIGLTSLLLAALKDYGNNKKLSPDENRELRKKTYEYCEEKRKLSEPISLKILSQRLNDEDTEDFLTFINSDDKYQISESFEPAKSVYNKLKTYKMSTGTVKIQFDHDDLGKKVVLNDDGTLVISQLDKKFIEEINEISS